MGVRRLTFSQSETSLSHLNGAQFEEAGIKEQLESPSKAQRENALINRPGETEAKKTKVGII